MTDKAVTLLARDYKGLANQEMTAVVVPVSLSKNVVGDEIDTAHCLNANDSRKFLGKNQVGNAVCIPVLTPDRAEKRQNGRRFKEDGDPEFTLTAQDKHGVAIDVGGAKIINPQGRTNKEVDMNDICPTLRAQAHGNEPEVVTAITTDAGKDEHDGLFVQLSDDVTAYAVWYEKYQCYITIRKLTPRECWRLQGWTDDYFGKAQFVNSDSQLYKQAGNGVTVPVIQAIAERMEAR